MNQHVHDPSKQPILMPGRNAWRIEQADAFAFLVDGAEYFSALERTLPLASRSIRIVGWDFNPDIRLRPDATSETLGALLRRLVEARPALEIHILVWAMGPIFSSRSLKVFRRNGWSGHPRIHLRFDARHALRGSHHQKMVTIDDAIAFVGGIDLTAGRWDTRAHPPRCPHRLRPNGRAYGPVHDVQAMFRGPAARAVADLARQRWARQRWQGAGARRPAPVVTPPPDWPAGVPAAMAGCAAAIVRTQPDPGGRDDERHAVRLTHDAIAAARRHIYIETQYLASFGVGEALAARLREPYGPEVAILVTCFSRGMIEQFVMASNRDRLIRGLMKADRFGRLRVMYAVVPDEDGGECEVLIHSKVLVVDDVFVRVGSSNLNNRSEGLDTECDVAVEARTLSERNAIAALRNRLLAEHLDAGESDVAAAIRKGSLVDAIDRLNTRPRGLRPFAIGLAGPTAPLPGTTLLDPSRPFRPLYEARELAAAAFSWLTRRAS